MDPIAYTKAYVQKAIDLYEQDGPEPSEAEWEAVRSCLPLTVDTLITEALARSGADREDLRR